MHEEQYMKAHATNLPNGGKKRNATVSAFGSPSAFAERFAMPVPGMLYEELCSPLAAFKVLTG
ncbi:hypothetical protein CVT25_003836 [Psilocybe cyanescens]|uniref:Uncharacterized protein n=1 Tax=Psilocybe cyanescens TaxID=93625 RepID=A0A409XPT1_PSICY|nr:hypothetical protein CVT25_003836 [Psilocybe cyanescens]